MKTAVVRITGVSPYSQSQRLTVPKLERETFDAYEQRAWRQRMHVMDGEVVIPPMAIKGVLDTAAKRLGIPIPGKGKSTFTKSFESGVMVVDPIRLGISPESVPCDILFVPADGRRGGTTRVDRYFPRIDQWGGAVTVHILDDIITRDVFERVLAFAGLLVGIGRFRPENRGFYGRFEAEVVSWEEAAL